MNLRNLLTWLLASRQPAAAIDPLADYVDWPPVPEAEPRVVEHRWRTEVYRESACEFLGNGIVAQIQAYDTHDWYRTARQPALRVVVTRWPSAEDIDRGRAPSPVTLGESRCRDIAEGLAWARRNLPRLAQKAVDQEP